MEIKVVRINNIQEVRGVGSHSPFAYQRQSLAQWTDPEGETGAQWDMGHSGTLLFSRLQINDDLR